MLAMITDQRVSLLAYSHELVFFISFIPFEAEIRLAGLYTEKLRALFYGKVI